MSLIKLNNISKSYNIKESKNTILCNLSLDIDTEQISVILGKSGCGKTTLLRLISKLENYDQGNICYPKDYTSSYVFQEPRLMPWLNVEDNISFGIVDDSEKHLKVSNLAKIVGLENYLNAYPKQLSGGMKQRVALARALATNPTLIYMDEPFAALDYFTRENMQDEIIKLYQETKTGILFVTHNIDEALKIAHKIVVINKGEIAKVYDLKEELSKRDILSQEYMSIKKDIMYQIKKIGE
ncbi:ABC transporter ATP-binding protein [Mycoplasma sp. P36-A1]|uniref:ABC transporter ATP-binding protein n=1 Tax=Mycoplasma sp. P36-A1 TaxID=3252900 RepID=UPI003C30E6AA